MKVRTYIVRVEMNDAEEEKFLLDLQDFKANVSISLYRGSMTVDEVTLKESV